MTPRTEMTRDQAIQAMDRLVESGYPVQLTATPARKGYEVPGNPDGRVYRVQIVTLGVDDVDLRFLSDLAGELGLMLRYTQLSGLTFGARDTTPAAVASPRPHPRR